MPHIFGHPAARIRVPYVDRWTKARGGNPLAIGRPGHLQKILVRARRRVGERHTFFRGTSDLHTGIRSRPVRHSGDSQAVSIWSPRQRIGIRERSAPQLALEPAGERRPDLHVKAGRPRDLLAIWRPSETASIDGRIPVDSLDEMERGDVTPVARTPNFKVASPRRGRQRPSIW